MNTQTKAVTLAINFSLPKSSTKLADWRKSWYLSS